MLENEIFDEHDAYLIEIPRKRHGDPECVEAK